MCSLHGNTTSVGGHVMRLFCYLVTFVFVFLGMVFLGLTYLREDYAVVNAVTSVVAFCCSYACAYMADNWDK